MANSTPTKTSFAEGNQPKKRRGKSERTKFLEALGRGNLTEDDFYDELINQAMFEKSPVALGEILKRVSPIAKAVAPTIEFKIRKDGKPHEKASDVLDGIANGDIPPDIGTHLITAIKHFVDLDNSDVKERLEKIEAMLDAK